MEAPADCRDLNEYLERFDLPLQVLQTREALQEAMKDLVCELASEGLVYAEIRFAPQLQTSRGFNQRQVVEAVLEGMNEGLKENPSLLDAGLILCCMRGSDNQEANQETVELAGEFIGHTKVAAVDLAGAEGLFFTGDYKPLFELAKKEISLYDSCRGSGWTGKRKSSCFYGSKETGHGVRCIEDPAAEAEIREKGIVLECCVTSNIQTRAFASAEEHPLLKLLRSGIKVTVNTDNMTVSNTTIAKEFELLKKCGMTEDEKGAAFKKQR